MAFIETVIEQRLALVIVIFTLHSKLTVLGRPSIPLDICSLLVAQKGVFQHDLQLFRINRYSVLMLVKAPKITSALWKVGDIRVWDLHAKIRQNAIGQPPKTRSTNDPNLRYFELIRYTDKETLHCFRCLCEEL